MADNREAVVSYVRQHGPLLPVKISKELNTNILFASAILGELVSNKKLKLTSVKAGGSPFYYIGGQEVKLQQLSRFLGGKEKEAYEVIREKGVIRDRGAEPWQRVALRSIKDYAVPLEVEINGQVEVFWKWYLLSNELVKQRLEGLLKSKGAVKEEIKVEKDVKEEIKKISEPVVEKIEPKKVEEVKEELKVQQTLRPVKKVSRKVVDDFYEEIYGYLEEQGISVTEDEVLKKGKECVFTVLLPSKFGNLSYLVYAKDKKTVNDSDLVLAMEEGKVRKLPVIFLSTGSLTKKGAVYLKKHVGDLLVFKEI